MIKTAAIILVFLLYGLVRTCGKKHKTAKRKYEKHKYHEPPAMIPCDKSHSAAAGRVSALFRLYGSAISGTHFFGTRLSANRTVFLCKKATAIRTFIQIRAVKFIAVVKIAQHSSHAQISFRKNYIYDTIISLTPKKVNMNVTAQKSRPYLLIWRE